VTAASRRSQWLGWAYGLIIVETIYKGCVIAHAYHRSPTYPWARFRRLVGNPELFIGIDQLLVIVAIALAVFSCLAAERRRWAVLLLVTGGTVLLFKDGPFFLVDIGLNR